MGSESAEKKRRLPFLLRIPLLILGAYVIVIVAGCLLQKAMIFPSSKSIGRTPRAYQIPFEEVVLPVDGEESHGWFVPLDNARGTVLFSHGNAGNMGDRLETLLTLRTLGFSVLVYDYGGYGESTGSASEDRCYADAQAMWDYLVKERGVPPAQIVLFGRSLGGGPTTYLASRAQPAAVVLESTFLSTNDVAREAFPWLLAWPFIVHRFANKERVADISSPVLIIHSPDDSIIPYAHGQGLFALATEPKTFLEIHGDHNEGFFVSEPAYSNGWKAFLAPILPWDEGEAVSPGEAG